MERVNLIKGESKRKLIEILNDLAQHIPPRLIKQRKQGGATLDYIEWHTAARFLDVYTNGFWEVSVIDKLVTTKSIVLTVRITIHADEMSLSKENVGYENLELSGYGDPFSNAYAMAFKRAYTMFADGSRQLYDK